MTLEATSQSQPKPTISPQIISVSNNVIELHDSSNEPIRENTEDIHTLSSPKFSYLHNNAIVNTTEPDIRKVVSLPNTVSHHKHNNQSHKYGNDNGLKIHTSLAKVNQSKPIMLSQQSEDTLSVDMLALYEELLPTAESIRRKEIFTNKIQLILNSEFPEYGIEVHAFGSFKNDLGSSDSDVDLCVTTEWNGLQQVQVLARLFRRHGMKQVSCIPKAKVPIVKLWDPELRIACDVNVNNTLALHNTRLIKTYVNIDPRVRPLAMIIKYWAKQRAINDAAKGGTISTYTWTLMVLNFMQMRAQPILPILHQMETGTEHIYVDGCDTTFYDDVESLRGFGDANKESLGGLLFAFFRRFAYEFDYNNHVISIRYGKDLTKAEKGWVSRGWLLCVEEPFNTARNLGNSADEVTVRGLIGEFRRAFSILYNKVNLAYCYKQYRFPTDNNHNQVSSSRNTLQNNKNKSNDKQDNSLNGRASVNSNIGQKNIQLNNTKRINGFMANNNNGRDHILFSNGQVNNEEFNNRFMKGSPINGWYNNGYVSKQRFKEQNNGRRYDNYYNKQSNHHYNNQQSNGNYRNNRNYKSSGYMQTQRNNPLAESNLHINTNHHPSYNHDQNHRPPFSNSTIQTVDDDKIRGDAITCDHIAGNGDFSRFSPERELSTNVLLDEYLNGNHSNNVGVFSGNIFKDDVISYMDNNNSQSVQKREESMHGGHLHRSPNNNNSVTSGNVIKDDAIIYCSIADKNISQLNHNESGQFVYYDSKSSSFELLQLLHRPTHCETDQCNNSTYYQHEYTEESAKSTHFEQDNNALIHYEYESQPSVPKYDNGSVIRSSDALITASGDKSGCDSKENKVVVNFVIESINQNLRDETCLQSANSSINQSEDSKRVSATKTPLFFGSISVGSSCTTQQKSIKENNTNSIKNVGVVRKAIHVDIPFKLDPNKEQDGKMSNTTKTRNLQSHQIAEKDHRIQIRYQGISQQNLRSRQGEQPNNVNSGKCLPYKRIFSTPKETQAQKSYNNNIQFQKHSSNSQQLSSPILKTPQVQETNEIKSQYHLRENPKSLERGELSRKQLPSITQTHQVTYTPQSSQYNVLAFKERQIQQLHHNYLVSSPSQERQFKETAQSKKRLLTDQTAFPTLQEAYALQSSTIKSKSSTKKELDLLKVAQSKAKKVDLSKGLISSLKPPPKN
ncbi:11086_t:CDS:2 [Ambispora gerdemannii]|uniref:polynucleotide adenylyltransferase n=1 Tax=Ambispora gerdemannii TaxID=144530 RepID=A0A9N8UW31_9GLOM|nr:11086_t:CDS:2 [Ambispora gerdemannii]